MVKLKRVYETAAKSDGFRVLVDRLWPRGVSKRKAKIDLWIKEIGPSNELRKWFGHKVERWPQFKKRYKAELRRNKYISGDLYNIIKKHKLVTLVYGAKDEKHNQAVVLKEYLHV